MKTETKALSFTLSTALLATLAAIGLAAGEPAQAAGPPGDPTPVGHGQTRAGTAGQLDRHPALQIGPQGAEPGRGHPYAGQPENLPMLPAPAWPTRPWRVSVSASNVANNAATRHRMPGPLAAAPTAATP
jgi:hypothetical protein